MKKSLLFLLFIFCNSIFSQKIVDTIASKSLDEDREITIGLPASYDRHPNQRFPILLLLDGDFLFDPFQGALNYGNYWDDLPEVIIVAITQNKNNERATDCTIDETTGLPSEKGALFYEFIGLELIPYIEKKYRAAPFKIIAGLDTTASFLNYFLFKDDPVFNAYIAMSPEHPSGIEEQIPDRLALINKPIFYYHSIGEGDSKKMRNRNMALDELAKKIEKTSLYYKFDDFKGASHYSLVLNSIPSALYHIFSVYQPISNSEYNDKIVVLPSGYVAYLIKKYEILEKSFSLKIPIRVNDFIAIEQAILKNKAYIEFNDLAQLAKKYYPKSMLADFEMGLMYEKMGENSKALKSYMSAYQREEIGDLTKEMLLNKMDELKAMLPKKGKNEKIDATIEEIPTPDKAPIEEKKNE